MTTSTKQVSGVFVNCLNEEMYRISNFDQMPPFFMSIVSSSELWMYLSSTGCLTAGRNNPDNTIFPYYTVDRIHDNASNTGPITLIKVNGKIWQPFSTDRIQLYNVERNLYKNIYGSKIVFEEINHDLQLRFRYSWSLSEQYGFVRHSYLKNLGEEEQTIEFLDGVQNILPHGISRLQQMTLSNLMDAYKRTELDQKNGLALFYLNAIPVDRAEPSESLITNLAWSDTSLDRSSIFIDANAIDNFISNLPSSSKSEKRAGRGAYLIQKTMSLAAGTEENWRLIIDSGYSAAKLSKLHQQLNNSQALTQQLDADLQEGEDTLKKLVASADGFQLTADQSSCARHFSNTLFNIMRGGVFYDNYTITKKGFLKHIETYNKALFEKYHAELNSLSDEFTFDQLREKINQFNNPALSRVFKEYLPIIFSRRHGDPSRPWNIFNVSLKDEKGNTKFYYQGNWRDIFQNWEALLYSFPEFTENIIAKFVNASTADGYNPYRISSDGIDWEEVEPDDPWSYIGYWGDHQVIYLQRLLEVSQKLHPGKLKKELNNKEYVFAHVPYIIKGFKEILQDPYSTILFDQDLNKQLLERYDQAGADGKLYHRNGAPKLVSLAEKLLVSTLTKLYNFIPDAGVWLNTQRPEWNDANNALVGYGCSMVTVYYLHRQLAFYKDLFQEVGALEISVELAELFHSMKGIYENHASNLNPGFNGNSRWEFVESLGEAGEKYREAVYAGLSADTTHIEEQEILSFFDSALSYLKKSIESNKRADDMFHAYNLIHIKENYIEVNYLYEMLEGQVAVLSSNYLSAEATLDVLNALRESAMYRPDQQSYMLYPNRDLPFFLEKNLPNKEKVENHPVLKEMLANSNTKIIYQDAEQNYRFAPDLKNGKLLQNRLEDFGIKAEDASGILALYEDTFQHRFFTGRSGTFFGYEGLGSIYWHMVSKLQLAVAENYLKAKQENKSLKIVQAIRDKYYEVKHGVGADKSPEEYGAFPFDPYSHTPANSGVKQPGMTGQVKEDILSRMLELGLNIENAAIHITPHLLKKEEFLNAERTFDWIDLTGAWKQMNIPANHLVFTLAQVPIILSKSDKDSVEWFKQDGTSESAQNTLHIPSSISQKIFDRTGDIEYIKIEVKFS